MARTPVRGSGGKSYPPRIGGVRPSQLMYAYGVGATLDLPNMSVVVAGLDDWNTVNTQPIAEDRLLGALTAELGRPVRRLLSAPWLEETRNPFEQWAWVGVPVLPFPRWMRCPACSLLTTIDSGLLELRLAFRPDKAAYVHKGCTRARGKPPVVVPARFVVACSLGHLDDFPWVEFCHQKTSGSCPAGRWRLTVQDIGPGVRSTDVLVTCDECGAQAPMMGAFGDGARAQLPRCRGRHPHLRRFDESCPKQAEAMLLGASNAWFPVAKAVLSLPASSHPAEQKVAELGAKLDELGPALTRDTLSVLLSAVTELRPLLAFELDEVWSAIEARRSGSASSQTGAAAEQDILGPEWRVLCDPHAEQSRDFRLGLPGKVPGVEGVAGVVPVERLREVVALYGFTRVDGPDWGASAGDGGYAPLSRNKELDWLPAAEVRGEGIFLRLDEEEVAAWESSVAGRDPVEALREANQSWRRSRGHDPATGWVGERYVLLHSLSHALINELALECGYATASIRERIYARRGQGEPMAGVLLYTAAPDSEGTLGGLVTLAEPDTFGRLLEQALRRMGLCSSDPMCAEHRPDTSDVVLHAAACHACLFVPETSCERGNRFLDRSVLVDTLAGAGVEYFR